MSTISGIKIKPDVKWFIGNIPLAIFYTIEDLWYFSDDVKPYFYKSNSTVLI